MFSDLVLETLHIKALDPVSEVFKLGFCFRLRA